MNKNEMSTMEFLNAVLAGSSLEDTIKGQTVKAKAEALKAAIEKRNAAKRASTSGKPSKAFLEAEPIRQAVLEHLGTQTTSTTVKEIATAIGSTSPKVSAALKQLVAMEKVDRLDFGRNKALEYKLH